MLDEGDGSRPVLRLEGNHDHRGNIRWLRRAAKRFTTVRRLGIPAVLTKSWHAFGVSGWVYVSGTLSAESVPYPYASTVVTLAQPGLMSPPRVEPQAAPAEPTRERKWTPTNGLNWVSIATQTRPHPETLPLIPIDPEPRLSDCVQDHGPRTKSDEFEDLAVSRDDRDASAPTVGIVHEFQAPGPVRILAGTNNEHIGREAVANARLERAGSSRR